MSLFGKLFGSGKTNNDTSVSNAENESAVSLNDNKKADDREIVAVIMAALMNMMDRPSSGLYIKSIRRSGRNSPVWNLAGRDEYLASKL